MAGPGLGGRVCQVLRWQGDFPNGGLARHLNTSRGTRRPPAEGAEGGGRHPATGADFALRAN